MPDPPDVLQCILQDFRGNRGKVPSQKRVPLFKLLSEIEDQLDQRVLIVALDDINFLPGKVLNEALMTLVKSAEI